MSLTQAEADFLMELEKRFTSDELLILGAGPIKIIRDLVSLDGREKFLLNIYRGSLGLRKHTFQERARSVVPLVRLDIGETLRHVNPDGRVIEGSHIHIYREGYDSKYAFPLDEFSSGFPDPNNVIKTLEDFARFCNIAELPAIQGRFI